MAQVNHLLNLEATYKAVCEKRETIPFKWGPQPERDLLQERANNLAGEIMRTERRIIEGLKASASKRAAGVRSGVESNASTRSRAASPSGRLERQATEDVR